MYLTSLGALLIAVATSKWDWAVATGVLAGTKAAELLSMLDDPTLANVLRLSAGPPADCRSGAGQFFSLIDQMKLRNCAGVRP